MSRNLGSAVLAGKTKTFATNFTDLHGLKQKKSVKIRAICGKELVYSLLSREKRESRNLRIFAGFVSHLHCAKRSAAQVSR
jgi:hypothetical protein